jgi:hypothetical protein
MHSPLVHLDADLNKVAKSAPQVFSIEPGVLAARWAKLKQALGWDDRQCREAIAKCPLVGLAAYGNQYAGWLFHSGVTRNQNRKCALMPHARLLGLVAFSFIYMLGTSMHGAYHTATPRHGAAVKSG